ncbi:DUF2218 domain-containing protein [Amycolatopsis sp. H20-H5]|uniref:DUF2218 domain-containing protein n=1 Tax=Amycolatopsis sp. H20-H5 TaxID=3046309 RepID=UPI002DBCA5FA|nr:DUF2218 domain-containing protein [Amycolatopsis sp. H20-H5]MEC3974422.1 DUF2218 domain-containing protein [Amycolatopsis sp. H20-H5]
MTSETDGETVARRKRRTTIGLAAAAVLAVAVHLGLAGAAWASAPWTGWATNIVLAVVVVKVVGVTVMTRLATRRGRASHRPDTFGPTAHLASSARHLGAILGLPWTRRRGNPVGEEPITRSVARIPTPKGERYAKQLCSHAAWKTPRAEWTPPDGVIEFPADMGTCRMTVEPDHLLLAIEATDAANLARIQQIIGANIERFASRDGLTVEWIPDADH